MKRLAAGLGLAFWIAVIVGAIACPRRSQVRPDDPPAGAPAAADGTPQPPAPAAGAPARPPASATDPSPEAGDARLQAERNLSPPTGEVAGRVTEYSVAEHQLLAEVERKAGTIPPGVREVIARRRAGASHAELEQLTKDSLKGDLVARAVVLEWLDGELGAGAPAQEARKAEQPLVKPLQP